MHNQPATNNLAETNPQAEMHAQTVEVEAIQKLINVKYDGLMKMEKNPLKKLALVFKKQAELRKAKTNARSSDNMYSIN